MRDLPEPATRPVSSSLLFDRLSELPVDEGVLFALLASPRASELIREPGPDPERPSLPFWLHNLGGQTVPKVIAAFQKAGGDVDARNPRGESAVLWYARNESYMRLGWKSPKEWPLLALLDAGAASDLPNQPGVLSAFAENTTVPFLPPWVVTELVQRGASVKAGLPGAPGPLMRTLQRLVTRTHFDEVENAQHVVSILLAAGASPFEPDDSGASPVSWWVNNGVPGMCPQLDALALAASIDRSVPESEAASDRSRRLRL